MTQTPSLELVAPPMEHTGRAGLLSYHVAGEGPPLLLLHSINATGAAFEMRPTFDREVQRRRVYAVDLPGFGRSDRSDRDYCIELYVDAVLDMLDVIENQCGSEPVEIMALSLAAEFAARAANAAPHRIKTLTMITPTGFDARAKKLSGEPGEHRGVRFVHLILQRLGLGRRIFPLLTKRSTIGYFLRRTWGSDNVDPALIDAAYASSHQPGAHHAPLAFLSGFLFSADVNDLYRALTCPVWIAHGTRGDFKDFSGADWARSRENWTVQAWETGAMVHYEKPDAFLDSYRNFLDS